MGGDFCGFMKADMGELMFGGLQSDEGATWDWRNAERIADMPFDMISADWISLPVIFSNLVKSSMTDSEVVVLTGGEKKNGIEYETITSACISYQSP